MKNAIEKLNGSELNGRKLVFIEDYKPRSKRRRYFLIISTNFLCSANLSMFIYICAIIN